MSNAREIALKALIRFRRDGSWPDLYLKNALSGLSSEDSALCTNICYGVMQNAFLLDFYISHFSSLKLKKIMPQVLDALRCGAYQLLFTDKIPDYAIINETVALVKKLTNPKAASFTNAVLRKIADNKDSLPQTNDLSVLYSHPGWLVERLSSVLGQDKCESYLKADNSPAPVYIRVNTLKTDADELSSALKSINVSADKVKGIENALLCRNVKSLYKTDIFEKGYFYIQDAASQLAVTLLSPCPGDTLLDMCAAPGGKSICAAQMMNNEGKITAVDLYPFKTKLIEENAQRLSVKIIETVCADSSNLFTGLKESADKVICDVPCSGFGVIRKKPDIRYKTEEDIINLPSLQRKILENAAFCLKKGGRMVYSTCTVLPEENENITDGFLTDHKDYYKIPFENAFCGKTDGSVTLYPHENNCDGFYICLLGRR